MTPTTFTATEIARLTAIVLDGAPVARSADKPAAIRKLTNAYLGATGLDAERAAEHVAFFLAKSSFDEATSSVADSLAVWAAADASAAAAPVAEAAAPAVETAPAPVEIGDDLDDAIASDEAVADCLEAADGSLPRPGSKNARMLDMVRAAGGATEAEICAAIGWAACRATLGRVVAKAGLTLTSAKDEATGRNRYFVA